MPDHSSGLARRSSTAIAVAALSFSTLFAGVPVAAADTFDDDGGSSYNYDDSGSYDEGGYDDGYDANADAGGYADSGSEFDYSGAEFDGIGQDDGESDEGTNTEPSDEPGQDEPNTSGEETPAGGPEEEPTGGGMQTEPSEPETPGGGMQTEPSGAPGEGPIEATPLPPETDIPTLEPGPTDDPGTTNTAPTPDVKTASDTKSVQTVSKTMTSTQVSQYSQSIKSTFSKSNFSSGGSRLRSPVSRWNSGWTGYDHFYRPVFTNPFQQPMQVMYRADGAQQVLTIPPLQKAVLSTRLNPGVYSFTSMVGPENGPPTNISVGSFSGGGYKPRPGQEAPPKPPAQNSIKNALVQVKFNQGTSQPFRVGTLVDLGQDASVNNSTRVLLDGEIPAWGQWSKTDSGEALFVISETQLLPGIKPPAQEPLPGYNVKLVSSTSKPTSAAASSRTYVIIAAAAAGVLALIAVVTVMFRRRKKSTDQPTELIDAPTSVINYGAPERDTTTPIDGPPEK